MVMRQSTVLALFIGCLLTGVTAATPAFTQGTRELERKIDQLRRDVDTLRAFVYRGGVGAPDGATPAESGDGGGLSNDVVFRIEQRLNEMDREVRELNDKVETLGFRLDQLGRQRDQNGAAAGGRPSAGIAPGAQSATRSRPSGVAPGSSQSGGPTDLAPVPQSSLDPKPLGTISKEEYERLRSGEAANGAPSASSADASQTAKTEPKPVLPKGTPDEQYAYGQRLIQRNKLEDARAAFREFVKLYPDHKRASNALFWIAQTHFAQEQYVDSAKGFAEAYKANTRGPKAQESLLKLGMSLSRVGKNQQACTAYNQLDNAFPRIRADVKPRLAQERKRAGCS